MTTMTTSTNLHAPQRSAVVRAIPAPAETSADSSALAVFIGLGGYAATMAAGVALLAMLAALMH